MEWLAIALVGLMVGGAAACGVRRLRRRSHGASVEEGGSASAAAQRQRPDTVLSELRDMRDALGPATHNRVERRRTPGTGAPPKAERRKKGTHRVL